MRSNGNFVVGISIVVIGVILFLQARSILSEQINQYWPVLLIFLGGIGWITQGRKPTFGNVLVIALGILFLYGYISRTYILTSIWPIFIILVGINLAIASTDRNKCSH